MERSIILYCDAKMNAALLEDFQIKISDNKFPNDD